MEGVRREGEMRMSCVPVAELGSLGSSFHQGETAKKERIEKHSSGDGCDFKSLEAKTNSVLPFRK